MDAWDEDADDDLGDAELERLLDELAWAAYRAELAWRLGWAGLPKSPPVCGWWPGRPQLSEVEVMSLKIAIGQTQLVIHHEQFIIWDLMHSGRC